MTEDQLQSKIFKWMWNEFPHTRKRFFAVPNGGLRNKREASKLKSTGVVPGIPDMIFIDNGFVHFFELKTESGRVSNEQKMVHVIFKHHMFPVYVIRSIEQFQIIILYIMREQQQTIEWISNLEKVENVQFFGLTREKWEYQNKVFEFIFNMKNDVSINFDDICEKENQPFFVDCIKKFVLFELDHANGFDVQIKSDWTAFRRQRCEMWMDDVQKRYDNGKKIEQ